MQNKYYPDNLNLASFADVPPCLPYSTFVSYTCWQRNFYEEYIKLELKIFFIISERFLEW